MEEKKHSILYRFLVGILIGSGFIVPGVSGGALAAIFGVYDKIIKFLANITKDFTKNFIYFIPLGIGGIVGVVAFSFVVSFLLGNYETIILWFFIGCIVGSIPALWKEAGKNGRNGVDYATMIISFIVGVIILKFGSNIIGNVQASFFAWIVSGALIALGILVPGLSPSNFIVYMGLYEKMSNGFKSFDFSVIIPIGIGGLLTVLLFSKLIEAIYNKKYSLFFHFIFGIVLASTVMIVPLNYSGFTLFQYFMCLVCLILGILMGYYMSILEEKYK